MIKRGSVVWFTDKGKTRLAIVLRDESVKLTIICGSTRPPNDGETDFELLEACKRTGKAFNLKADTWFKKTFITYVDSNSSQLSQTSIVCPSWLLQKLDRFT